MLVPVDLAIQRDVAQIAVIFAVEAREARTHIVAQRNVDGGTRAVFACIEIAGFGSAAQRVFRPLRYHADHASRCVLAEQRALRSAQHFDPVDID